MYIELENHFQHQKLALLYSAALDQRIAHELGHFDPSHFIKDFQDQVGRSPAEYVTPCAARATG